MSTLKIGTFLLVAGLIAVATAMGFWWGRSSSQATAMPLMATQDVRKALYWYDPMKPEQHFDKPGRSPFMDMDLIPKYAGSTDAVDSLTVPSQAAQNLGMRTTKATMGILPLSVDAVASLAYNQRDVATLQARTSGYVEKVYGHAPGEVLPAGTPLADLLVPEWSAAQLEFIAVKQNGDNQLVSAALERLRLLGIPKSAIDLVQRSGKPAPVQTIVTPIGGELQSLELRVGMTVSKGQDLAKINGLSSVWIDAAIPESAISDVRVGSLMTATPVAFPSQALTGKIIGVLPSADIQTRTLTVRSEIPNLDGTLRPGMFATVRLEAPVTVPLILIPSESVIRTGKRTVVMVAESQGRYRPQEVRIGREANGKAEVVSGLSEGQEVVSSGQFLIDSEASLQGLMARDEAIGPQQPQLHTSTGEIIDLDGDTVTLKHGPFKSLGMPGMTMPFPLAKPEVAAGLKVGDNVDIAISKSESGLTVERLTKQGDGQ